jgi:hypothetical protein
VNLLVGIALVRALVGARDEALKRAAEQLRKVHHPSSKAVPVLISRQHD